MPKLSERTLSKRFACSGCGKSFRTRQGLSGHIRFKHGPLQVIPEASSAAFTQQKPADSFELSPSDLILKAKKLKKLMLLAEFSEKESQAFAEILSRWIFVKERAKLYYKIDVSFQDFNSYVLTSIARWFEFEGFKKDLDVIFQKHVNRLLETLNVTIK